jgi:REP element-mobilizing transposase RayT
MMDRPWRKRIRLPAAAYLEGGSAWHVTIGTQNRADQVFTNQEVARAVARTIETRCAARGAGLDLYCLMPDHCHLIIQVRSTGLIDIIGDVKSCTTRAWWNQGNRGRLWQRSFYDHGLRTERDYTETIRYILENPVRAGIVADWGDYPHIGGALIQE